MSVERSSGIRAVKEDGEVAVGKEPEEITLVFRDSVKMIAFSAAPSSRALAKATFRALRRTFPLALWLMEVANWANWSRSANSASMAVRSSAVRASSLSPLDHPSAVSSRASYSRLVPPPKSERVLIP